MIAHANYELDHINELRKQTRNDPALIEKVLFAFGLLEALKRTDLPFIFKGGTSLMLLLDKPKRLSTDIDILIEPGMNLDSYLNDPEKFYPFTRKEEQIRKTGNGIVKRHFRFYYHSPYTGRQSYILLDAVFAKNPYCMLAKREINNPLLLTEGLNYDVDIPTIDCILGDKLCAFAPDTIGIQYGMNKDMEIIKQMFDISCLIDEFSNMSDVKEVYQHSAEQEAGFRGKKYSADHCLKDTIRTCLCICSRGKTDPKNYPSLLYGIRSVGTHIFGTRYSGETASRDACKVLCFSACLLSNHSFQKITEEKSYLSVQYLPFPFSTAMFMKRLDLTAFGYLVEASRLLESIKF